MYDIVFVVYIKTKNGEDAKRLANTLDPYPDEEADTFHASLSKLGELPKFSDFKFESESELLFTFTDHGFLASEIIGEVAKLSNCEACFALEYGDTQLFSHYQSNGKIKLIYADEDEYNYSAKEEFLAGIQQLDKPIEQLLFIAKTVSK